MQPVSNRLPIRWFTVALLLAALVAVAGCAGGMRTRHYTSVVEYLYPDAKDTIAPQGVTTLSVPVKVGIAFVPGSGTQRSGSMIVRPGTSFALTESERMKLLEEVASHFRQYEFVDKIEIIPSAYLTPQGGFTNLDQIRAMYGVDVIALVSYDQVQFTDEGLLSFTYWTIVGAYVVPGDINDTHTMLDTAVYHIPSRRMLLRAPGTSLIKGRSTLVNLSEQLRADSAQGFDEASTQMITNLDQQLDLFRERLKAKPAEYAVQYRAGYSGGGGGAPGPVLLAALVVAVAARRFGTRHRGDR